MPAALKRPPVQGLVCLSALGEWSTAAAVSGAAPATSAALSVCPASPIPSTSCGTILGCLGSLVSAVGRVLAALHVHSVRVCGFGRGGAAAVVAAVLLGGGAGGPGCWCPVVGRWACVLLVIGLSPALCQVDGKEGVVVLVRVVGGVLVVGEDVGIAGSPVAPSSASLVVAPVRVLVGGGGVVVEGFVEVLWPVVVVAPSPSSSSGFRVPCSPRPCRSPSLVVPCRCGGGANTVAPSASSRKSHCRMGPVCSG